MLTFVSAWKEYKVMKIRKLLSTAVCSLFLLAVPCFAAGNIEGVWGLEFGISPEEAARVMSSREKCPLICEYEYMPNYHEAFYKVDFFGREGHMLLRFSKKGLFLARMAFIRDEDVGTPVIKENDEVVSLPRSRNYRELKAMLEQKYGHSDAELTVGKLGCGEVWADRSSSCRISLMENRSQSRNDTVLSYEDIGRH